MEAEPPPTSLSSLPFLIVAIVLLLFLSLSFSIAESSYLSMNKLRLRIKKKNGERHAVLASKLLSEKEVLINSLLLANDLVNILLSSITTALCVKIFGVGGVAYATFAATLLLLIFGEITPKTISTHHADSIAYALSGFVSVVVAIFKPISRLLGKISKVILIFFGINLNEKSPSYTEEEIRTFIDYSSEEGAIDEDSNVIMRRIFKFTDLEAQNIMTPRTQIVALSKTARYAEIIDVSKKTKHSRFPVYCKTIDNIVGILYLKDLLSYSISTDIKFSIDNVMRKPIFILGAKKMSDVRHILRENRQTIAIVVDEYSGTGGILTQEDITERIFGQISKGNDGFKNFYDNKISNIVIEGNILLADISEQIGINLTSEINETLGGWLEEKLDRLPTEGDIVYYKGWQFTIESIELRRVATVRVQLIKSQNYSAAEASK